MFRDRIKRHGDAHNLTSSWTQCANLYYPFGQSESGRMLFASFLKECVSERIKTLNMVKLEYECPGNLRPRILLSEKRARR